MSSCVHCGGSLREGAKFCAKCGNRVVAPQVEVQVTKNDNIAPAKTLQQTAIVNAGLAEQASKPIVAAPRNTAGVAAPPQPPLSQPATSPINLAFPAPPSSSLANSLNEETFEISSWQWNWGAFLVPGVWLMAHRIRPKIVPLVLLGVPIAILSILTMTTILAARSAEQAAASGVVQGFSDQPEYIWSNATMVAGWLLALYIAACLLSIRMARTATLEAWRNFPQQDLPAFRSSQRLWAAGGLLICATLITTNIIVWSGYDRAKQAAYVSSAREFRVRQLTWASQGAAGGRVVLRFYSMLMAGGDDCSVEIGGKSQGGALATFAGDTLTVSRSMNGNSDPAIGKHTYKISADEQTLTEVGGDGQVLHPTQSK